MLNPAECKNAILAIEALGSTPAVLAQVARLAKDPNADLATLGALMRNDGALAADIIRISNSSYYAPATLHGNVASAINQIGLGEVMRVVSLSLARQLFARDLCSYGVPAHDYWCASVAVALLMEGLAKRCGLNPEDAYTLGILHAIGRVLINRIIEEQGFSIFWDGHEPIEEWERDAVGFDYAEAGTLLLEHWHFPAATCEVVRWQLHPEKVVEPVSLLGALQFSRRLLALTGLDFRKDGWHLPEADPFVRASGLTLGSVVELSAACRDDLAHLLESMGRS